MNNAMNKLDKITIAGFKSIKHAELPLERLTVLIGPNGSGKTNLLGVFTFLSEIRKGRLRDYVDDWGGADTVLHFGPRVTERIRIELAFEAGENEYEIELRRNKDNRLIPSIEVATFWDREKYSTPLRRELDRRGFEAGISEQGLTRTPGYVQQHLASWRVYHFHDTSTLSPLKKTADVDDNRYLRADGSNLASFLYLLRKRYRVSYDRIEAVVQQMAPFFCGFALEPQELNPEKIRLEWQHHGTDAYFGVSSLSDGTLRFMALATLFLQPSTFMPSVILIDEPELGLHPYAITLLAALIKKASVHTQVIVSTQSSLLVDLFEPEEVLVADRVDGATRYSRPSSFELESWLEDYSLGQLWEKGWLGGRPTRE